MSIKSKLSDEIIKFQNGDKKDQEKWTANRDKWNFPKSYRAVFVGPPNSGKTNMIMNFIARADPTFDRIIIIHPDATSKDYEDLFNPDDEDDESNPIILKKIPPPDSELWESIRKKRKDRILCVIDDIDVKHGLKKSKFIKDNKEHIDDQASNLDRLFGYISSHKNVSVIITSQNWTNIPPIVRRVANIWVLWKIQDSLIMKYILTCAGYTKEKQDQLLNMYKEPHDCFIFDNTIDSPYKIRFNGNRLIEFDD